MLKVLGTLLCTMIDITAVDHPEREARFLRFELEAAEARRVEAEKAALKAKKAAEVVAREAAAQGGPDPLAHKYGDAPLVQSQARSQPLGTQHAQQRPGLNSNQLW